jgi:hypothetical protein
MPKKALPPAMTAPDCAKELEHLYAQLSAVETLIRALKRYKRFHPQLIVDRKETA